MKTTYISFLFQLIEKLTPEFDERRYQASKAFHNKQKNRHNNILAGISRGKQCHFV